MTTTIITSDSVIAVVLNGSDHVLLTEFGSLIVTDDEAISATGRDNQLNILGLVFTDRNTLAGTIAMTGAGTISGELFAGDRDDRLFG
jgi:hypothetical protein